MLHIYVYDISSLRVKEGKSGNDAVKTSNHISIAVLPCMFHTQGCHFCHCCVGVSRCDLKFVLTGSSEVVGGELGRMNYSQYANVHTPVFTAIS